MSDRLPIYSPPPASHIASLQVVQPFPSSSTSSQSWCRDRCQTCGAGTSSHVRSTSAGTGDTTLCSPAPSYGSRQQVKRLLSTPACNSLVDKMADHPRCYRYAIHTLLLPFTLLFPSPISFPSFSLPLPSLPFL